MKLTEFVKTLAARVGIADTEAKLTETLGALPDIDIDDDAIVKPITENLITESEATNRPTIKNKFTAEALNGIDSLLDPALVDFFEGTDLETFKNENKATTKKLTKLIAKAKELKASAKPGDQAELNRTINQLNETIDGMKTSHEEAINSLKTEHEHNLYYVELANTVVARGDVTDYAKAKKGKRVITDLKETIDQAGGVVDIKTNKIMQKGDPSMQLYIGNKPATIETMLDKTLTENDYIKKSDPAPTTPVQVPVDKGNGNDKPQQTVAAQRNSARLASS